MNTSRFQANQGLGLALVLLGGLFLLAQFTDLGLGRYGWPFFVILPGLALFAWALLGGKSAAGLTVPASIVTAVGLILFYQNVTGRFETWAYAWALVFPTSVGLGILLQGLWADKAKLVKQGRQMSITGLTIFLGFAFFFEFILNFSGMTSGVLVRIGGPLLLIAGGALLLYRQSRQPFTAEPQEKA